MGEVEKGREMVPLNCGPEGDHHGPLPEGQKTKQYLVAIAGKHK